MPLFTNEKYKTNETYLQWLNYTCLHTLNAMPVMSMLQSFGQVLYISARPDLPSQRESSSTEQF